MLKPLITWATLLTCMTVCGQEYAKHVKVEVDKIRLDPVDYRQEAPRLQYLSPTANERWMRLEMIYSLEFTKNAPTGDFYVDAIQFDWTVVFPATDRTGKPSEEASVRFQRTITYGDVEVDGEHRAVLYIHPRTYDRYKKILLKRDTLLARCRITIAGRTKMISWFDGKNVEPSVEEPKNFPKTPTRRSWFSSEEVRQGANGVVSRMHTPWVYASHDQYELITSDKESK